MDNSDTCTPLSYFEIHLPLYFNFKSKMFLGAIMTIWYMVKKIHKFSPQPPAKITNTAPQQVFTIWNRQSAAFPFVSPQNTTSKHGVLSDFSMIAECWARGQTLSAIISLYERVAFCICIIMISMSSRAKEKLWKKCSFYLTEQLPKKPKLETYSQSFLA